MREASASVSDPVVVPVVPDEDDEDGSCADEDMSSGTVDGPPSEDTKPAAPSSDESVPESTIAVASGEAEAVNLRGAGCLPQGGSGLIFR